MLFSGTYAELLQHDGAFAELIRNYLNEADNDDNDEDDPEGETLSHFSILSCSSVSFCPSGHCIRVLTSNHPHTV